MLKVVRRLSAFICTKSAKKKAAYFLVFVARGQRMTFASSGVSNGTNQENIILKLVYGTETTWAFHGTTFKILKSKTFLLNFHGQ